MLSTLLGILMTRLGKSDCAWFLFAYLAISNLILLQCANICVQSDNTICRNNYLRANGFTMHRNPVAQSTDSVRGKFDCIFWNFFGGFFTPGRF